jgi:hypothetical protein
MTGIYYRRAGLGRLPTLGVRRSGLEITDVNSWYVEQGAMGTTCSKLGDAGRSIDAYYEVNDPVRST